MRRPHSGRRGKGRPGAQARRARAAAPSREAVLRALGRRGRPLLTRKALLRELGLQRHQHGALSALLRELEAERRVERIAGRYRLRRDDGLVEATLQAPAAGSAPMAALADDGTLWQLDGAAAAAPGDRGLLAPLALRPTPRAEWVRTVEGGRRHWIGILNLEPHGGVVTPYRDDQEWGLRVPRKALAGARDGDVVVVAPARGRRGAPGGRVLEVLGPPGAPEADFRALVWRHRLPLEFPGAAVEEAERASRELDPAEVARRVDLRERPFVTIDPATARDHDDAVCVEPVAGGGARLWVAIADVAHYVAEGSALDTEALRRGNSVYFPDRAIPMLPERLSGELCSLRPDVDRLVMVVELELDAQAQVTRRSFYPGVIRSRRRLAYEQAAAVMEGEDRDPELRAWLLPLAELARRLVKRRFAAGSIDFDLPAAEIVLGDEGHPVDIVEAPRTLAHRAIEEAMLAANRAVAEWLGAARVPLPYRVHEPPLPGDMEALRELLASFGLLEARREAPLEAREIARAIQRAEGRPEERLVNGVALRSMRQARYEAVNRGHFALAFESYTHFTSPIRRYADLVVHRALKDWLEDTPAGRRRAAARAERLPGLAARVSFCERVAMEAEREAVDLKKCAFMARHVGGEFDGTVTGVARHGFYVTLDPFFVEGLVHVSTLRDYVVLDERAWALVSRESGERYALGDRVRVAVDGVDLAKAWINFSLVARLEA